MCHHKPSIVRSICIYLVFPSEPYLAPLLLVQFSDPKIRQFNLVAVDMRAHGETKGKVPKDFDQEMAAEDMAKFMVSIPIWYDPNSTN